MDRTISFKKISHTIHKYSCENENIKRIKKGEKYITTVWSEKFPEEDIVKKKFFTGERICIAKEDMWNSGGGVFVRTNEEVIEDWNGHVFYNEAEEKWYSCGIIEIHFLDGNTHTLYFKTDKEIDEKLDELFGQKELKTIIF